MTDAFIKITNRMKIWQVSVYRFIEKNKAGHFISIIGTVRDEYVTNADFLSGGPNDWAHVNVKCTLLDIAHIIRSLWILTKETHCNTRTNMLGIDVSKYFKCTFISSGLVTKTLNYPTKQQHWNWYPFQLLLVPYIKSFYRSIYWSAGI